jgi:hypothetical protein
VKDFAFGTLLHPCEISTMQQAYVNHLVILNTSHLHFQLQFAMNKTHTALDLIHYALDLSYGGIGFIHDDLSEGRNDTPPIVYRLNRMKAMMKAFDVEPRLREFTSGDFLNTHPLERYQVIIDRAQASMNDRVTLRLRDWPDFGLPYVFKQLFEMYAQIWRLQRFNQELFAETDSLLFWYAVKLTDNVGNTLSSPAITEMEEVLSLLVSPEGLTFTYEELLPLGFPTGDLDRLDAQWM